MPDADGYELLVKLRLLPGMKDVPAIAFSGYAMEEDYARALASGFAAHLAKPIDPEKLLAIIQKLNS
jgi:CheY-like chemotaxis protein